MRTFATPIETARAAGSLDDTAAALGDDLGRQMDAMRLPWNDRPERVGYVEIFVGDGIHRLKLGYEQLIELEEKTGLACGTMYGQLVLGNWSPSLVNEVIRLALIGGGMEPKKAYSLVQRYVAPRPLQETGDVARFALHSAVVGFPADLASAPGTDGEPAEGE